jgi:hypothetical protein
MTTTATIVTTTKRGKGNRNIQEMLEYAIKSKRFIGGLCKLEKDGTLSKINGQVFSIRTTKSGVAICVIDNLLGKKRPNQNGKRWQAVLVKNIVCLREHHWEHKRVL